MTLEGGPEASEHPAVDLDGLRELLAASERRAATFADLTALMNEGRDPLALAQRGVEVTARATRAAGAFVYLWDRDAEQLVLRAATAGFHQAHIGRVRLRMGEGVTGWVALMRQAVTIADAPYKDPRFLPFPGLRETAFQSMIAVPIVAPGEDVLGVFTLYANDKHFFHASDVSLATEVGALLASGLVQAETVDQLKVQSAAAQFLRELPDEAWGSLERCLGAMATLCVNDLDADICIVEVTTDHSQPGIGNHGLSISERFREEYRGVLTGKRLDRAYVMSLVGELDLQRLRIPLGAAAPIGAVTCYRQRRFTRSDETLLEGLGAQIAAGALSLYGMERARPVLDQLFAAPGSATSEAILKRFGWRSRQGWATVIRAEIIGGDVRSPTDDRVRELLHEVVGVHADDHVLLGGGTKFLAVCAGDAKARDAMVRRLAEVSTGRNVRLAAGVGPHAQDAAELHRSIRHASHCAHWAELTSPGGGATVTYEEVARLRLLPRAAVADAGALGRLIDSLVELVRYDLENGTELAHTLDVFLTNSGHAARSSAALFIHRNTLRQRIQRVEELIGHSPEDFEDWVTAGLAVRIVRESERDVAAAGRAPQCPHNVLTLGRACCGVPSNCVLSSPPYR